MFFAFFFWAVVTWSVAVVPDWMLCYFIPAAQLNLVAVHGLFLLALALAGLSGHTITAVLLQRGRTLAAGLVFVAGLVMWFGLWGITLDRYMAVGTYEEWVTGTAVSFTETPHATAFNVMGAAYALVFGVLLVLLVRAGRRLRPA